MKLTIDQMLQQGVAAHNAGNPQEAERPYRAILQVQPKHPDANHNLGLIAVSMNQSGVALPLFKSATDVNPNIEQFWLSYIEALIAERQFEKAKQALKKGKKKGVAKEKLKTLTQKLVSVKAGNNLIQAPSQAEMQKLINHYQNGQYGDAETLAISITEQFPGHQFAWKVLGAVFGQTGQVNDALNANQKAVQLEPQDADAHNNLGATLQELGRFDGAEASYRQLIALKSDDATAHYNLGITLKAVGRLEEAIASLNKAIELKPDFVEAHHNLGVTLTSFTAKSFSSQLEKSYLNLLNLETVVRPDRISHSVISLLKHHNTVKEAISYTKKNDIKNSVCELCIRLSNIPLFLKIIELCPIADLEIESLLKNLRKILLLERQALSNNHKLLRFQSSLALQCFTNEFIYEETEEETLAVKALETTLQQSFTGDEDVSPYDIACLAGYRPLHLYPWATDVNPPSELASLLERQVIEVNQELALRRDIPRLNPIENDVSLAVQKQYEENPYPRWINTRFEHKPLTITQLLSNLEFQLDTELNHFSENPQILVAGCGTGQHSLLTATRFKNSQVTAIDLSLSSLSYAMRKTREYGVTNIDYIQADILDLRLLGKQFDIVESVGVLHHMKDPLLGWKVLESCLKPGGLMLIGLYGEVSRKHVVKARDIISNLNIGTSHKEMVRFREHIKRSTDPTLILLKREVDFYSTSTFRDLVFHVQEHRFTAPELYRCFNTLDLIFIGFEYPTLEEKKRNQALYPNWGRGANCGLSDELDFPRHIFWLQKSLSSEL